jgi:hypothetical protein
MPRRQGRPGLVGTMARTAVISGTATAVSGSVAQRQHARAQAGAQAAPPQAPSTVHPPASEPPPAHPAAPPAPDALPATQTTLAELERLVALKQQGLLTDDEFTALKARLIAP